MKTVVETPTFVKSAGKEWSTDERLEFISWIAANSDAGDVIPGADVFEKCDGLLAEVENVSAYE